MDLILKECQHTLIDVCPEGYISIEQKSVETDKWVCIYLSPEQFRAMEKWFAKNYLDILEAWNGGAENG